MVRTGSRGRRARRGPVSCGLLVAALLASACGAPPRAGAPAVTTPLRGIAPAGPVTPPLTFTWDGDTADRVVRVSIEDRAQRPVFAFPARGASATAPEGIAAVLTPGEMFTWTVAVVDDNGGQSRTSAPVEFEVGDGEVRD
jgi:hypothetical protein